MAKLYYEAPSEKIFEELKARAIEIWNTYDNEYGYVDEKVNRIEDMKNIRDNFMCIVAMFDHYNQIHLATMLSEETKDAVRDRMIDGGTPKEYILF